ncbi:protein phosphatase 2C domain-containing protein [Nocardioides sp. WG-D5]
MTSSIETRIYSETSPTHEINEDLVLTGQNFVIVLDGASPAAGLETGCVHDVPWLVRSLGLQLAGQLMADEEVELPKALEVAIRRVCESHENTCDLSNPNSPSSTVALLRRRGRNHVDYLALADSSVVFRFVDGTVRAVTDDRLDHLADYSFAGVAAVRNTDNGFWVASTRPEAAHKAVSGSVNLQEQAVELAAVLTDGAATLVERHGRSWAEAMHLIEKGPEVLILETRNVDEDVETGGRGKRHDDATAVAVRLPEYPYEVARKRT